MSQRLLDEALERGAATAGGRRFAADALFAPTLQGVTGRASEARRGRHQLRRVIGALAAGLIGAAPAAGIALNRVAVTARSPRDRRGAGANLLSVQRRAQLRGRATIAPHLRVRPGDLRVERGFRGWKLTAPVHLVGLGRFAGLQGPCAGATRSPRPTEQHTYADAGSRDHPVHRLRRRRRRARPSTACAACAAGRGSRASCWASAAAAACSRSPRSPPSWAPPRNATSGCRSSTWTRSWAASARPVTSTAAFGPGGGSTSAGGSGSPGHCAPGSRCRRSPSTGWRAALRAGRAPPGVRVAGRRPPERRSVRHRGADGTICLNLSRVLSPARGP